MFLFLRIVSILLLITCLFVIHTPSQSGNSVFPVANWFTSSDVPTSANVGPFISMSGDTVVLGSPHDSDSLPSSGSARVFVRDGENWIQQQKLVPTTPIVDLNFGRAVSTS